MHSAESKFYGAQLAAIHAEAFEGMAEAAAATLLRLLKSQNSKGRVLDLGCGAGRLSGAFLNDGYAVWGIDISPAFIALARRRAPGAVLQCGSIADAVLPPACAAAAVGEVFNYLTAFEPTVLRPVLRRVFEALLPDGIFLLDVAAPGRGQTASAFTEGPDWAVGMIAREDRSTLERRVSTFERVESDLWQRVNEEHFLCLWEPVEIVNALVDVGFSVERIPHYDGFEMPPGLHVYCARRPE